MCLRISPGQPGVDSVTRSICRYRNYPSRAAEQLYTNCKKDLSSAQNPRHGIIFLQVNFIPFLSYFARGLSLIDNHGMREE